MHQNPVGKVICSAQSATGGMIGIAHVNLDQAPVGCELYALPSGNRLKLQVAVSNSYALECKKQLEEAKTLLLLAHDEGLNNDLHHAVVKFLGGL